MSTVGTTVDEIPYCNRSAQQLPLPAGARRWASAAGTMLAEWYATDELAEPAIDDDASTRLKEAAFIYVGWQNASWMPRGNSGSDVPYAIYDLALEIFRTRSAQRRANPAACTSRGGPTPQIPDGDVRERMHAASLTIQHNVSDAWMLDEGGTLTDDGSVVVPVYMKKDLQERAWFILTARDRLEMHFRRSVEEPCLDPEARDLYLATHDRLLELFRLGHVYVRAAFAARRAFLSGTRVGLRPSPQPYGVSPDGAEQLAAAWMIYLGATGVKATRAGRDGGLDVCADKYVAQVKAWAGPVGAVEVRAMAGIAAVDHRTPLFFATTGYTADALRFALSADMALFVLDAVAGRLEPVTTRATALRECLA